MLRTVTRARHGPGMPRAIDEFARAMRGLRAKQQPTTHAFDDLPAYLWLTQQDEASALSRNSNKDKVPGVNDSEQEADLVACACWSMQR
jgi:hypothetical protein